MRILQVHNRYQQPGGEDAVVTNEATLLQKNGHEVFGLYFDNKQISETLDAIKTALNLSHSRRSYIKTLEAIKEFKPDILHAHNTFPIATYSIYQAANEMNVPVVQTIHNYRFACANGLFLRDQKPCELCLEKKSTLPAIKYRCYRNSRLGTAAVARMISNFHSKRIWKKVSKFLAVSEFVKTKMIESGIGADNITVQPNFVSNIDFKERSIPESNQLLFVGRLSIEKGIRVLVEAARKTGLPLVLVGDGPEAEWIKAQKLNNVTMLGKLMPDAVHEEYNKARFLILPSICYEADPLVISEAYAHGLPVIGANLGGIAKKITKDLGYLFQPGNSQDLAKVWTEVIQSGSIQWSKLSANARTIFENDYSENIYYKHLFSTYNRILEIKNSCV